MNLTTLNLLLKLLIKLPDVLSSWIDMQDAMDCEMLVQSIEPGSKKTTNKAHSNENQNILYVPQITLLCSFLALWIKKKLRVRVDEYLKAYFLNNTVSAQFYWFALILLWIWKVVMHSMVIYSRTTNLCLNTKNCYQNVTHSCFTKSTQMIESW